MKWLLLSALAFLPRMVHAEGCHLSFSWTTNHAVPSVSLPNLSVYEQPWQVQLLEGDSLRVRVHFDCVPGTITWYRNGEVVLREFGYSSILWMDEEGEYALNVEDSEYPGAYFTWAISMVQTASSSAHGVSRTGIAGSPGPTYVPLMYEASSSSMVGRLPDGCQGRVEYKVYAVDGSTLGSGTLNVADREGFDRFSVPPLPVGVVLLKLQADDRTYWSRVLVQ